MPSVIPNAVFAVPVPISYDHVVEAGKTIINTKSPASLLAVTPVTPASLISAITEFNSFQ